MPADYQGRTIRSAIEAMQTDTLLILVDVSALPSWQQQNVTHDVKNGTSSDNNSNYITNTLIFALNLTSRLNLQTSVVLLVNRSLRNESASGAGFVLSDLRSEGVQRPLLYISINSSNDLVVERNAKNLAVWWQGHVQLEECDDCKSQMEKILAILVILGCSSMFVICLLGVAALARNQLLRKRVSKGPYKVLLTATDFVFPQVADSRRVSTTVGILFQFLLDGV